MGGSQLDGLVDEITPATETVRICTRGDLVDQLRRLEQELADAQRDDDRHNRPPKAPKIAKQIEALEAEARGSERGLTLQAIGAAAWSDLLAKHPPTKQQRDQYPGLDHNPETFPYAAVAASLGEPDDSGVRKLVERISQGQWSRLWGACLAVNVGEVSVPFSGRAYALLRGSEQSSTSAADTASPAASS
jgi:hypothetical protein